MFDAMYSIEEKHWWFRGRREIALGIINSLNLDKSSKIIDLGCGTGYMLRCLSKYGQVTGVDFNIKALEYCRQHFAGELLQLDLNQKQEAGQMYSLAIAMDVLEHLENESKAMENIRRILGSDGHLILTVPAYMFLWSNHDVNCRHKRRYTLKSLRKIVDEAGFTTLYMSYYNFWFFPIIAIVRTIQKILPINKDSQLENAFKDDWVNRVLYEIFYSEKYFIENKKKLPFGVSIIAVLKRQ